MKFSRKILVRILAGAVSLVLLLVFMLSPLVLFRMYLGVPLDAEGPKGEIWILIAGCGLGAGAARFSHDMLLNKVGKFTAIEKDRCWDGKS